MGNDIDHDHNSDSGFDVGAAVTRSLLGWGVVAGAFYLTLGIVHGVLAPRFSFAEHPLSFLMLTSWGWVQAANLVLSGLMVLAAAVGFHRSMRQSAGQTPRAALAVGVYGVGVILGGIFEPDPVDGFPDPTSTAATTTGGMLHLAFGGVGFVALMAAAWLMARWHSGRGDNGRARWSKIAARVIGIGFLAGAALGATPVGVALLWIAVVAGWAWLADTSIALYRIVPHPDRHRRVTQRQ